MVLRKRLTVALCAAFFAVCGCGGNAAQGTQAAAGKPYLQLTDAANSQVSLAKKPERVVSLSPSYLGMIEAVGGKIVGRATSRVGTVPQSMAAVPEVGFVYNVNMESLLALRPDLVLAGKNHHEKFLPLLKSNNVPVIVLDAKTYDEIKHTVTVLGDVYGTMDKAAAENAFLDEQIAKVKAKLPKERKRVVIMHATASSVTVEGSRSIAGCVSDILGFENVAAAALKGKSEKTPYSMESLVHQNPDVIFITSMGKADEIENRLRLDFKNNPAWNSLQAVQQGKVYVLPEQLFLINPGLRYPEAVKYMAQRIYPEVFEDGK